MIVKCPHCEGKMRVDESHLTSGERVKVRCPHCNEVSSVGDATKQPGRSGAAPGLSAESPQKPVSSESAEVTREPKNVSRSKAMDHEPAFPKDAFQTFRFPAETETATDPKKPKSSMLKIILWIVVSLAIIAFFALLVNLVLPGPSGLRPFGGTGKTEQTLPSTFRQMTGPKMNPGGQQSP